MATRHVFFALLFLLADVRALRDLDFDDNNTTDGTEPPWKGRLAKITADDFQKIVDEDGQLLRQIQKDLLLCLSVRRHLPVLFSKKFHNHDRVRATLEKFAFSVAESLVPDVSMLGPAFQDVWRFYKVGKFVGDISEIARKASQAFAARAMVLLLRGGETGTDYAKDVTLDHLYQAYAKVKNDIHNNFYAKTQDWYKFRGRDEDWVPILERLAHLNRRVGKIRTGDEFILDEVARHVVPIERVEDIAYRTGIPAGYLAPIQPSVRMGSFGHLGDGRGWVRIDVGSYYGGLGIFQGRLKNRSETSNITEEIKKRCELVKQNLSSLNMLDDKSLKTLRSLASDTDAITSSTAFNLLEKLLGPILVGVGVWFPPSLLIKLPIGLILKTMKYVSLASVESFLRPILQYVLGALASLEMAMSRMKPRSKLCDLNESGVENFNNKFGEPERIECDILTKKCREGMYCLRAGVFTNKNGFKRTFGYCMKAEWPLLQNGLVCMQDEDCLSGVCRLGVLDTPMASTVTSENSSFNNASSDRFKILGGGLKFLFDKRKSNHDLQRRVNYLMGVCVEPCPKSSSGCDILPLQEDSEFGYLRTSMGIEGLS